ncbi:ATP-binding protein [Zoogloea sp.]|uniref:ATP-binding protein n=1 Tax=Zoogloea sp. TaxID=49181 RepID=UPI0026062FDF|nr:ATP-binding protein [Zoogloea sp.]
MDNIAGSPVEGENFFGRNDIAQHLRQILDHDDILLLGPRRIGKTSLARAVMAITRKDGWKAIEIVVASCIDEKGFLDKLEGELKKAIDSRAGKLWDGVREKFGALGKRIKSLKFGGFGATAEVGLAGSDADDWITVGNELLALLGELDDRWLIYVDELPIMLFNIIRQDQTGGVLRVRRFLDWFRNDVRALAGAGKVRWLISGSVGLDTLVQEHGMADTINSLNHQNLPPFTDPLACQLIRELATSYKITLDDNAVRQLVDAVSWPQPYYLQIAFQQLRSLIAASPATTPQDLIETAIDQIIQPGVGADNDFHHWEKRLDMQLAPPLAALAKALLAQSAARPGGTRAENLLDTVQQRHPGASDDEARALFVRLRDILLRDAYWLADDSSGGGRHYRFALEPLRRWWNRRNSL